MQGLIGQGCRATCAAVLALLVCAGVASAADPWRPIPQSCVSSTGTGGACAVSATARGLWKVAVAPGGTHAYGIAHESLAIIIFDRDPSTGR